MKARLSATLGLAPGALLFLALFVAGTVSLAQLAGSPDPDTARIMERYQAKIGLTLLRIGLAHLWLGLVLGALAGLVVGFLFPQLVRRRWWFSCATFVLLSAFFVYGTAHLLIRQPTFFDQFFQAHRPFGPALQYFFTHRVGFTMLRGTGLTLLVALLLSSQAVRSLLAFRRPLHRRQIVFLLVLATGLCTMTLRTVYTPPRPEPAQQPNILLISVDSLRPDHMSHEGYSRPTSPHLDQLAREGRNFRQAFVPVGRTLPSWVSLLTSTDPHTHGIRHMFPESGRRRVPLPTLPEMLHEHGYRSAVVSDYAGEMFDLIDLGFDRVDTPPASHVDVLVERQILLNYPLVLPFLNHRLGKKVLPVISYLTTNSDPHALARRAVRRMRELADAGPFLLTVFFSTTHAPYASPEPFYRRFTDPDYAGQHRYAYGIRDPRQFAEAEPVWSAADRQQIIALYDGAIAAVDDAIGEMLDTLTDWEFDRDTLIIVTADHGEHLFEGDNALDHGKWFRGGDRANHVPLIIKDPGGLLGTGPVDATVRSMDLMPTLLARLGITPPASCEGEDLGPALRGEEPFPELPLNAETGIWLKAPFTFADEADALIYPHINGLLDADPSDDSLRVAPEFAEVVVEAKHRMLRQGRHKLVYEPTQAGARYHLYDVLTDPLNRHDLGAQEPRRWTQMREQLFQWLRRDSCRRLDSRGHLVLDFSELWR